MLRDDKDPQPIQIGNDFKYIIPLLGVLLSDEETMENVQA